MRPYPPARLVLTLGLVAVTIGFASPRTSVTAAGPALAAYYKAFTSPVIDSTYVPSWVSNIYGNEDLDGDGHQDLLILGGELVLPGKTAWEPQPGRILLGDGNGGFRLMPPDRFPVAALNTVFPRKILFADVNADTRPDIFIAAHGWDTNPFPGEQNRLYLSTPDGRWEDATSRLPALNDFTHAAAAGDVSGRGIIDIFAGNGYSGQNHILPYMLLNSGTGEFTLSRAGLPVKKGERLDIESQHMFNGTTFADLDGDGLPELIVTGAAGSSFNTFRNTTIFWNRQGMFANGDVTVLPEVAPFQQSHEDMDAKAIDFTGDGLLDLVVVGTQGNPAYYDGWFVQLFVNQGNRRFVEETYDRLAPADAAGGIPGEHSILNGIWPMWITPLDFDGNGTPDFSLTFSRGRNGALPLDLPIIWLNDGTGRYTTLKVGDIVADADRVALAFAHVVPTKDGYSFIHAFATPGVGLRVRGVLATKPYRPQP